MPTLREIRERYQSSQYYEKRNTRLSILKRFYCCLATPIVKFLLKTKVSANQITSTWIVLGLTGCYLFTLGSYWFSILAIIILQLHTILDYVDGPIARAKNSPSLRGIYLERVGHDLIYTLFFYCIAIGVLKNNFPAVPTLILGFLASVGYFFFKYTRRAKIYCTLIYDQKNKSHDISPNTNKHNQTLPAQGLLRQLYRRTQVIWMPVTFTIITGIFALLDRVYWVLVFYAVTYPIHFVISWAYQAKIDNKWVYQWLNRV